jgi:hypothetical protein
MRNRTEYEGALDIDDRLVCDLIGTCLRSQSGADSGKVEVSQNRHGLPEIRLYSLLARLRRASQRRWGSRQCKAW